MKEEKNRVAGETATTPESTARPAGEQPAKKPFKWSFLTSGSVVLLLVCLGQALGAMTAPYWDAARGGGASVTLPGLLAAPGVYASQQGFGLKDVTLLLFALSSLTWVVLQRKAVARFFRAMQTGVSLVVLSTLAVCAGVLVPQIDGFEDPDQRVTEENFEEQYDAFRFAQSYFFYHLLRPYGIGMPEGRMPDQAAAGLEEFALRYGDEEAANTEKRMAAAVRSQPKMAEIQEFAYEHDGWLRGYFKFCTALELNRAYKSSWFATLLTLLAISMGLNTFRGSPRSWFGIRKLGFACVHIGMLCVLGGGFVSKLGTDRGLLELYLDAPAEDTYFRHYDPRKLARMPFKVRLDHFARKEWLALQVEFPEAGFSSRPPVYTLWEGREVNLCYREDEDGELRPGLKVRVLKLQDKAEVGDVRLVEATGDDLGEIGPVVEYLAPPRAHGPADADHEGHDHGARPDYFVPFEGQLDQQDYHDPAGAFRLRGVYGDDPRSQFPDAESWGMLDVTIIGSGVQPQQVDVVVGEETEIEGGYRVRFDRATSNFRLTKDLKEIIDPRPLEEQPVGAPAVWVTLTSPAGVVERRPVFEQLNKLERGLQGEFELPEVVTNLYWNRGWSAPGPERFVLWWKRGEDPLLVGEDGTSATVKAEQALPLPGETKVLPLRILNSAVIEKDIHFLAPDIRSDGWDADFYSRTPRGAVLELVHAPGTAAERTEIVRMATTQTGASNIHSFRTEAGEASEDVVLYFFENVNSMPQDWRSVLSIIEKDGEGRDYAVPLGSEKQREIRVNDYFTYGNPFTTGVYRFFQTNADARRPTYSGIGVVYDPGIPIVLFGMYTVIAGSVIAFLIRPIVLARRAKETA